MKKNARLVVRNRKLGKWASRWYFYNSVLSQKQKWVFINFIGDSAISNFFDAVKRKNIYTFCWLLAMTLNHLNHIIICH